MCLGDLCQQSVKPPGAARNVGTRHFRRIANGHQPALQPDPVIGRQAGRTEQPMSQKQPPGDLIDAADIKSHDPATRPHIVAADISRQQDRRI